MLGLIRTHGPSTRMAGWAIVLSIVGWHALSPRRAWLSHARRSLHLKRATRWLLVITASLACLKPALAAELDDAQKLFHTGKYAECLEACQKALKGNAYNSDRWRLLKIQAEMATGQYADALKTYEAAAALYRTSILLRLLGYDVLRANDRPKDAQQVLLNIEELLKRDQWQYSDVANRVAIGRVLLLAGADARQVLELFYDQAKKISPSAAEPHIAAGDLALDKQDFALAAEAFAEAAKRSPDNPDVHLGLARAFTDDSEKASEALAKALAINPQHVDSLLFQVDNAIDAEEYEQAESILKKVLAINAKHARAWAYRAVLAHLTGDYKNEEVHRKQALATWKTNPEVDHLIGQKLSQKYRFAEGAAYQRQALVFSPNYRPAKVQLCQDLLRLGEEDEGWRLAAEIFDADKYNVVAYNLSTLHDNLSKFTALENDDFLVRMDEREAQLYGPRVLDLLARAKPALTKKYDVELDEQIIVEIFPQQKDFAIRTFGLPGGAGFLGVCFGGVITANSPASQGATPSNWEAVLWHEFCHVVTLNKTRNKMPRWLSEGISVYEERQENPSWGQRMTPTYREMVLKDEATPVSQLSGAFLKPKSPMHLQFAYYQSSMVVEYLVGRYGLAAVQRTLDDLGEGIAINQALARHTEPMKKLDDDFARWFKVQAEQLVPGVDLEKPELEGDVDLKEIAEWNSEHPKNFWGLILEGEALIAAKKWDAAKRPLKEAAQLYPAYDGADGPLPLLASIHRELGETEAERSVLEKLAALDADAVDARLRLTELAAQKEDWSGVSKNAAAMLAVNPLVAAPHRHLARAAEALGERKMAIDANRALLILQPLDRAEIHFRLARLLRDEGQPDEAKRHVLEALEQAPRYLAAHRLLLELKRQAPDNRPGESPKNDEHTTDEPKTKNTKTNASNDQ
jgi:tetratricopeptide (TPR) repeat protein